MSTSHDRLRTLVEGIYLATESGKIRWSGSEGSSSFIAQIGSNRVEIYPSGSDIRVIIYNENGDEVDSFDDNYFREMTPVNLPYDNYYQAMLALHQNAKRSATGADRIIDSMISSLGISPVTDEPPF